MALGLLSCDESAGGALDAAAGGEVVDGYYRTDELERLGVVVKPVDERRSMICGKDGKFCMCLTPLSCELPGACVSFAENIQGIRDALQRDAGRTVSCDRAKIGHCGKLRYFYFHGDIHRDEMRWFDETGRLVGQRS